VVVALLALGIASQPDKNNTKSIASSDTTTTVHRTTTTSTTTASTLPTAEGAAAEQNGIFAEPRSDLTPGAIDPAVTQSNIDATICVSGYTKTVRPSTAYTDRIKTTRLAAYGYSQPKSSFELDHLIPLELGGAPTEVANLWPEPWEKSGLVGDGWGAETKDSFENYLKRAVCAHRMTLTDAQRAMAVHWIAAAQGVGIAAGVTTTTAPPPTTTTLAPVTTTTAAPPPPPSGDPSGATAQCADGSYSFSAHRSGTCSHHGGVARWINPPPS
jgi:hypothetical protein